MASCYRHANRETGVSCSSCGRPICPDCMTPTSVGMRCPECSRERTRVRTASSIVSQPTATYVLIAINVVAYLAEALTGGAVIGGGGGGQIVEKGVLYGPAVASGHEYWRLLTSGFLHAGILHLLFNMYFIYILGSMLEPAIGRIKFLALYFTCLLAGSFVVLLTQPLAATDGASGAAFGLLGGAIVVAHARGIDIWRSGLVPILLINVALTFTVSNISIGAHVGGALAGFLIGYLLVQGERRSSDALPLAGCVAVSVAAVVLGIAVAGSSGLISAHSAL